MINNNNINSIETPYRARWRGLALPITRTQGDYWKPVPTLDLVWSSIMLILGTRIGTRIMLPEFGSRLPELVFENNDAILKALAQRYIVDAISRWEKRIRIEDVEIETRDNEFRISMRYIVLELPGKIEGSLLIYRNQSFKLAENFYREVI